MPRRGTRGLSWCWAVAACCVSLAAEASPDVPQANDAEKATARRLVGVGDDLFATGAYEKALAAYRGADLIMGVPTTGFEVARCLMALGRLREARMAALSVLRYPERPGEPRAFGIARQKARALIGDLEERMAALRLEGEDTHRLVVEVDGRVEQIDNGVIYVDAGAHHVVVKRGDAVLAEHQVDVAERAQRRIPVDGSSSEDNGPLVPAVAIASFSVASGAVVTGIVTGALAFTMHDDALDRCRQDACPASAREDLETARALSIASTVSFVVGAVGTATGVAALLLQRSETHDRAHSSTMRASVEPVIGLQQIGLRLTY